MSGSEENVVAEGSDVPRLIHSIMDDARGEAARTVEAAEQSAATRRAAGEAQGVRLRQEAESAAAARTEEIRRRLATRLSIDDRRERLRLREQVSAAVLAEVRRRLDLLAGQPAYRDVLTAWIVEAAIGLGAEEAGVNATARERKLIDDAMLDDCVREVDRIAGRRVRLTLSSEQPLLSQGVVLTAGGGKVAYNNQVSTILLRLQSQIRRLIADRLFGGDG